MHGKNMVARLSLASENSTAVLVMLRLQLWLSYPKVRVQHDGEDWIANSLEEWALECGLTVTQVKYAFELMRQKNLVKTTMLWHRKRWLMHACFTPRTRAILAGGEEQICPGGEGNIALGVGAKLPSLIEQGEKQGDSKETSCDVPSPEAHDPGTKSATEKADVLKAKSVYDVVSMVKAQTILHKPELRDHVGVHLEGEGRRGSGFDRSAEDEGAGAAEAVHRSLSAQDIGRRSEGRPGRLAGVHEQGRVRHRDKRHPGLPEHQFPLDACFGRCHLCCVRAINFNSVPTEQEAPKAQTVHKIPAVQLMAPEDAPASYAETMAILNLKEK